MQNKLDQETWLCRTHLDDFVDDPWTILYHIRSYAPPLANSTLQAEIEIDVEVTELNTDKDSSPEEVTLKEDILMLKLDHEYWTWPRNKAPPPKVHHPQEGLGSSPNLYTDALGFDQISYVFKTGVCDVFEIT